MTIATRSNVEMTEITGAASDKQAAYAWDKRDESLHGLLCQLNIVQFNAAKDGKKWDHDAARKAVIDAANAITDARTILDNAGTKLTRMIATAAQPGVAAAAAQ